MRKTAFIALMLSITFLTACQLTAPAEEVTTEETPVVEEAPAVEVEADVEADAKMEGDAAVEGDAAAMEGEAEVQ